MKNFYYTLFLLLMISCTTGLTVYDLKPTSKRTALHEPFAVFDAEDEFEIKSYDKLGSFEFKDAGLTINCDYSTVLELSKDKARSIGANGIKITEHKYPDAYSSCHRIKGYFIYAEDIWKYENEITWHKERKLQFRDFRDSSDHDGFVSLTMSGFNVDFKSIPIKGQIQLNIRAFFNPEESFISSADTSILKLQQLHFDASELYSRKYIERVLNECKNLGSLQAKYQKLYNEIQAELRVFQREISNNAYRNIEERNRLLKLVEEGLETLQEYSKDTYYTPI